MLLKNNNNSSLDVTGSGKTLAFLIPAILKISQMSTTLNRSSNVPSPRILVVAPTRELASQSHDVGVELFSCASNTNLLKSVCIYGGVPKHVQKTDLRQAGLELVVATPGRLLDLIDEGSLSLSNVQYLVLDEADRYENVTLTWSISTTVIVFY